MYAGHYRKKTGIGKTLLVRALYMSVDPLTSKIKVKGFLFIVKKRQKQNSKKTNNYLYFISYGLHSVD